MSSGYSGKPLFQKLGLVAGMRGKVVHAPADYEELLAGVPSGAILDSSLRTGLDFVHIFARSRARLSKELGQWRLRIQPAGMIWVSWPKKSARQPTDITEDVVRAIALPLDLVDVKVCAVSPVWSGLKLVVRKEKRGLPARASLRKS